MMLLLVPWETCRGGEVNGKYVFVRDRVYVHIHIRTCTRVRVHVELLSGITRVPASACVHSCPLAWVRMH